MLRIGTAQADITPDRPVLMGGAFLKIECHDVLDPLMASCVVADDGHTRVAIVSCDLGSVPRDMVEAIREKVRGATGTPAACIHLTATHNHSAPTVHPQKDLPLHGGDEPFIARMAAARRKLVEDIAGCAIRAHDDLTPARMGHGRGRYEGGAYNRRFIMSNGRSRMHGGGGLERLRAEGPADKEVQVVWFENAEGRPLAVMVNYASHATNFYGASTVSADFPGVMRTVLQETLGKDMPVLYLQGACGNVMCRDAENPNCPSKGVANANRIGRALAGETLKLMGENYATAADVRITTLSRTLEIPYREIPAMPFDEAHAKMAAYADRQAEFRKLDIEERSTVHSALRLENYRRDAPGEQVELAAFALGDVFFVTNPAEYFVEFQLQIKERFKGRKVIVTELTNGRMGYVPTRLGCALGGYETIQTRFNPDAGEQVRDASCELIATLLDGAGAGGAG